MIKRQVNRYSPFSEIVESFAYQFDKAYESRDVVCTHSIIKKAVSSVEGQDIISKSKLYYSIGTAYGDLLEIEKTIDNSNYIEKQIYYFRKSIENVDSFEELDETITPYILGLKLNLFTNYANVLDSIGRKLLAIEFYNKALDIDSKFGMALGNLGKAYFHYAELDYDFGHCNYLHHFAYDCLNRAVKDERLYSEAKANFNSTISRYSLQYLTEFLQKPLDIPKYSYDNKQEYKYRRWALENRLFLNTLNDLPIVEFCFATDCIHLPNMVTSLDEKPVFHGMYNQLKQEFVFARFLQFKASHHYDEPHFADYPQYSIRIEETKTVFRILYSILDKVAYFINQYFNLGIKINDVSFRSIWKSEKAGKNGYKYRNILKHETNYALGAIKWIYKDFFTAENTTNPSVEKIDKLRNALEHRYLKVYNNFFVKRINGEIDDLAEYISVDALYEITMGMLKTVREVLINLSFAVHIEENKKRDKSKDKLIMPITLMTYEDKWKV